MNFKRTEVRIWFGFESVVECTTKYFFEIFSFAASISRLSGAHNPLVHGSSPCGPTNKKQKATLRGGLFAFMGFGFYAGKKLAF